MATTPATSPAERILFVPNPERPFVDVRVSYSMNAFTKGEAWAHLWANPPSYKVGIQSYMPYFEPNTHHQPEPGRPAYRRNPYRKDHGDGYWTWTVLSWVAGQAPTRKPPQKSSKKSRYEHLLEDWLDDPGVQD